VAFLLGGNVYAFTFWKDAAERAIRTAAQALLALWATDVSGVLAVDWVQAGSVSALAALMSLLMSVAATGTGSQDSASTIK
jgi:hypothetical protein